MAHATRSRRWSTFVLLGVAALWAAGCQELNQTALEHSAVPSLCSGLSDHPDHPKHPDHPSHPDHPEHPEHPDHPDHPDNPNFADHFSVALHVEHTDHSSHMDHMDPGACPPDASVASDPMPPPAAIEAMSITLDGFTGGAASNSPALSADGGVVAFASNASNLVAGDTNGLQDIFVHDRYTGTVSRVSVDSVGGQSNHMSYLPTVSADGNIVAFESRATNLVAGDTNGLSDIFVHDRTTGETTRVSVDSAGNQATGGHSYAPALSADGRFVAFRSYSTSLVPGDTNFAYDVFVHDRVTGETVRVSVDSAGNQAARGGHSFAPAISADGRFVAFGSYAANLVPGDTNGRQDIFVHDLLTGETTRASVDSAGLQAMWGDSSDPAISADGRFVTFRSKAGNLVAGDTNGNVDIFVHDRTSGATTRVSRDSNGTQAMWGDSSDPAISADGRFVTFYSSALNLVVGDTNGKPDVFVHDRDYGETIRLSVDYAGAEGNAPSTLAAISADGRTVALQSGAGNLVAGDGNGADDAFLAPNPLSTFDPFADDDADTLSNRHELMDVHTHHFKSDSDEDLVDDGTEVGNGTDPLDPASF